ncbi:MAG: hypothetical protein SV186_04885 [Candidatus Nanohaloarchaea archaeon]|nr:hypothetical protein [Candidatus Nanohaloarchaea archaeon]
MTDDRISPTEADEPWEHHLEVPDGPLYDRRTEVPEWKRHEPLDAGVKHWDDKNPYSAANGEQKESADHLL